MKRILECSAGGGRSDICRLKLWMADWQMTHSAARFLNDNNGTLFERLAKYKCGFKSLDHMRRSCVVQSEEDHAHDLTL